MPRTAVQRGPEVDAILAALEAGGVRAGDGKRPDSGGFPGDDSTQPFVPYAVVYTGVTLSIDGPVDDPNADAENEYQVTSVGLTRAQASFVSDKAREVLLNAALVVPGRHVQLVEWTGGQDAERDDDVTPPLFYVIDRYSVATSPA